MKRLIISESEKKQIKSLYNVNEIEAEKVVSSLFANAKKIAKDLESGSASSSDTSGSSGESNASTNSGSLETTSEYSDQKLYSPLKNTTFPTGNFGVNRAGLDAPGKTHPGIDLPAASNTELFSPGNGVVIDAQLTNNGCGGTLWIQHSSVNPAISTRYCHLKQLFVSKGDKVKVGQKVALTGGGKGDNNPGFSTGAHLHMEVYVNGKLADPIKYISPKFYDPNSAPQTSGSATNDVT